MTAPEEGGRSSPPKRREDATPTAASPPEGAGSSSFAGASAPGGRPARPGILRDRFTPVLLGLSALGAALILARFSAYGVSLSYDSINYLAVARHLAAGNGFLNYDWGPYALHPPLYPLLLLAASLGFFEPAATAGFLNAALFAATVFVVGRHLRGRVRSGWLACWGAAAVALSLPLAEQASWALSETAFVFFTTLALVRADDFLTEGRRRSLVGAAVFSALAWQTRYIGIAVPAAIAAALWFASGAPLRERLRRSGFVAVAAALPMALWTTRNYFAVGQATGKREFPEPVLTALLADVGDGLAGWFAFQVPEGSVLAAAVPAVAVFAAAALAPGRGAGNGVRELPPPAGGRISAAVFLGFGSVYLVLLLAAALFGATGHGIADRFLAPLVVPFLVGVALAIDRAFRFDGARPSGGAGFGEAAGRRLPPGRKTDASALARRLVLGALAAGLFLVLLGQVQPTLSAVREANSASPATWRGFAAPPWDDSETLRYLEETGFPREVWTNLPILLHLHYGMRAFFLYLPFRQEWPEWLENTEPGAPVVWFRHAPPGDAYDDDYGLPDLDSRAGFEPVARFTDGTVFRVNPDYTPRNPYRAAADAIAAGAVGAPAAQADFDLFLDGATLLYFREPCFPEDTEPRFFLHAYLADPALLSSSREPYGFENLDFAFREYGTRFEGKCVAIVELPEPGLARIRTGQYESGSRPLWSAEVSFAGSDGARSPAVR